MGGRTAWLAKISAPRLRNVYQRKRLFDLLDSGRDRNVTWISAPAGFGKTTLVASWLRSRPATSIWYNCDEDDGDIASFFHFLTLTSSGRRGRHRSLPKLSADLHLALPTFVRNYFREFCRSLQRPTVLVLDNWQDVPPRAELRALLPIIIGEFSADLTLIIISREEPDPNLMRLQSCGEVLTLGWPELQLDERETGELAELYARTESVRVPIASRDLHALTRGWAAGVAILLRAMRQGYDGKAVTAAHSQEAFDYFAAEVFGRLDEATRAFLLDTSVLDGFTAEIAVELSGNTRGQEVLERLVRVNAFTQRRADSDTYHYHPLFRSFLHRQLLRERSADQCRSLHGLAAQCLLRHGEIERAIPRLVEAGSRSEACHVVLQLVPTLIEQGRFRTALDHIAAVTTPDAPPVPWLQYWQGIARMAIDFPESRPTLEQAYRAFVHSQDQTGQLLTAATLLHQILTEFDDYGRMVPWLEAIERLLDARVRFPTTAVELSVLAGVLAATVFARPQRARIDWCRDQIERLLRHESDPLSRATAASVLTNYCAISGQLTRLRALLAPFRDCVGPSPAAYAHLMFMRAFVEFVTGDVAGSHATLANAVELVRHHGLPGYEVRCQIARLQTLDFDTHAREISVMLAQIESQLSAEPAFVRGNFLYLRGSFRLAQGRLAAAADDLRGADDVVCANGFASVRALIAVALGELACETGHLDVAREHHDRCEAITGALDFPLMDFGRLLLRAEIERRSGEAVRFLSSLRSALTIAREQGFASGWNRCSPLLQRLVPYALENGIETDYCRWLITRRGWKPPSPHILHWPWPIRIRTLGAFEILLGDDPLRVRGKQQRRPLNLLKALAAHPKGLSRASLATQLWPQLDGVSVRGALDMAIHRLRKLLSRPDAVVVANGRVTLNSGVVSTDAQLFEHLAATPLAHPCVPEELLERARRVRELYRGRFLPEDYSAEIERTRERLHRSFLRQVLALGKRLRALERWEEIEELYEHTAELEPLAEEIHSCLMEVLIAQDKVAAARTLYSRYRSRLARTTGIAPTLNMQRLYQKLQ